MCVTACDSNIYSFAAIKLPTIIKKITWGQQARRGGRRQHLHVHR
jgi:hypothetical protein